MVLSNSTSYKERQGMHQHKQVEVPKPTQLMQLNGFTIALHGLETGNWAMNPWKGDISEDYNKNRDTYERICKMGEKYDARTVYLPRPHEFNAVVNLGFRSEDANGWQVHQLMRSQTKLLRGPAVDGVMLKKHEACFIASADCPTIVAHNKRMDLLVVAHAGRECLYDKVRAQTGEKTPNRNHESVAFSIVDSFKGIADDRGVKFDSQDISVLSVCGIKDGDFEHRFDHPTHGEANRKMIEYLNKVFPALKGYPFTNFTEGSGMISMHNLIRTQFVMCGVPDCNISSDSINTYRESTERMTIAWHSHRRNQDDYERSVTACKQSGADASTIKPPIKGRNGVFVCFC
jgi:copper oxidase (laccase) domain-containing protein